MARTETVEFTNMCMICDGSRVVVIDRKKRDCISVLPSSAVSKTGVKISAGCCAAL